MIYLRRLPKFQYLAAASIDEVCDGLAKYGDQARLLAGGTDLFLQMRRREVSPAYVVGLKGVEELSEVRLLADGGIAIGSMATIHALTSSPLVRERYRVLSEAAASIGGRELRNLATVGGNLAGAMPCADLPPVLISLGAKVRLKRRDGERLLPVEELYSEFGRTIVRPDEVLTTILLPSVPAASAGTYIKFHDRQSMDMTTIGISVVVTWDDTNRIFRDVRIALASSAPVPLRAKKAEALLRGRAFAAEMLEQAALAVCEEAEPRTSWRATREFRFELLRGLTMRAIKGAHEKAALTVGGMS